MAERTVIYITGPQECKNAHQLECFSCAELVLRNGVNFGSSSEDLHVSFTVSRSGKGLIDIQAIVRSSLFFCFLKFTKLLAEPRIYWAFLYRNNEQRHTRQRLPNVGVFTTKNSY